MRRLTVLFAFLLAAATLAAGPPELHMAYQNVPRDGTGRLGGSAVDDLEVTHHNTVFWPTHVFAELFYTRTHDRFYREIGGRWILRAELLREYAALIDDCAKRSLDSVEATLGGRAPASKIWVFIDLEIATIQRRPYIEPEAEGYGSRDVRAMTLLCNRIEFLGRSRFPGVDVVCGMYHPIRQMGHWAGVHEAAPAFLTKWHGEQIWPLLNRRAVWIHNYTPEDPADFERQPQNHRQFTRANVRGQLNAILNSGARPEDVFVVDWWYTCPSAVEAEGNMRGVADVLAEQEWPWRTHLVWAGDWGNLNYLVDAPVEIVQRSPLRLSIDTALAGRVMAFAWIQQVEASWKRVFADANAEAAVGGG